VAFSTVVILAAGRGTRMLSARPKLAHDLCGRPLLAWPIAAARAAGAARTVVVVGSDGPPVDDLGEGVELAVQERPLGTADAVAAASGLIDRDAVVIVLAGDVPLVEAAMLHELVIAHERAGAGATVVTTVLDDPRGYGRIVRGADGEIERIVETKASPGGLPDASDATAAELAIHEVNCSIYAFDGGALLDVLPAVGTANEQGERYLTDVVALLRERGAVVAGFPAADRAVVMGVNDRLQLATVRAEAQRRIQERLMLAGVTIVQPETTSIDVDVAIGPDTVIEPCTQLVGATSIGGGSTIGPHTTVIDARLGDGVAVVRSHVVRCEVRDGATVGPFAYLRPDALLRERSKVGTFVEVKNSDIGAGAKVPHLSYVGDATIGEQTNLGAGTITANYDGVAKHRTTIGARVHGGVHTSLVAPVSIGDDAWTAAGSVVTTDVPPGALAVARARQRNVERYAERRRSP
jgi:bifunctional UDP-N-acetylglucosamine pyrophosphorylase/glucosamine-1-phosphate N-acetyltransferase